MAVIAPLLVRTERVQPLVPADARIVPAWPGRTLAILYLAKYHQTPVGAYHEIIVAPAMVRLQGKIGFWISHILVDSAVSVAAGRALWALPKQLASMQWEAGGQVSVHSESPQLSLEAVAAAPRRSIRLPFIGTALSKRASTANSFTVRGSARIGITRGEIKLRQDDGLRDLGWAGSRIVYVCSDMNITIGAPRPSAPSDVAADS